MDKIAIKSRVLDLYSLSNNECYVAESSYLEYVRADRTVQDLYQQYVKYGLKRKVLSTHEIILYPVQELKVASRLDFSLEAYGF